MNKILACIFFSLWCLTTEPVHSQTTFMVRATSVSMDSNGSLRLNMKVWNCSNKRQIVQLADLPWGEHATGIVVYVAGKRGGFALKGLTRIEDFPIKEVALPPNSSVSGNIELSGLYPDLGKYQDRANLVLFWVYDMGLIESGGSRLVGGMISLSSMAGQKKSKSKKEGKKGPETEGPPEAH